MITVVILTANIMLSGIPHPSKLFEGNNVAKFAPAFIAAFKEAEISIIPHYDTRAVCKGLYGRDHCK